MSTTEMYVVDAAGDVLHCAEAHNAHRGAQWIWNALWKKYLADSYTGRLYTSEDEEPYVPMHDDDEAQRIWSLWTTTDLAVSRMDRIAMVSTFDNLIVPAEHMELVAEALEQFEPGNENLALQAEELRKAKAEGYQGFCWNQTSVNCGIWTRRIPCEACGCTCEGESRPYNIEKDDDHRLFDPTEMPDE